VIGIAYSGTYSSTDTSNVVIDLIGTVLAGLVAFGSLIALVALYRWVKKKGMK